MHLSIPVSNTMEYITQTQVSPLISKGVCKVCYVGQEANRNGTVITKEVAAEMGRNLPGSPVVGYFDEETNDFAGHEREIVVKDGNYKIVDITKAYGFVPTDADVWFEKYNDEGTEHEYLVTEVYIWTETYPESKKIFERGTNQSMELSSKNQQGFWTNDGNSGGRIFIYNEALIEKLCILGQNVEPCFEGAQIKGNFSLKDDPEFMELKETLYSMMNDLLKDKGGSQEPMDKLENNLTPEEEVPAGTFESEEDKKKKENEEEEKKPNPNNEKQEKEEEDEKKSNDSPADEKKEDEEKKKYNLEEVTEYTELQAQYNELQSHYSELQSKNEAMAKELNSLREFKLAADRKDKQSMIDSFYMLSEEDKKDVKEHIDTYSLDDIEAKLSILCVRNKVDFSLDKQEQEEKGPDMYSLAAAAAQSPDGPEWIRAVRETAKQI